jgi:hypothetical protein
LPESLLRTRPLRILSAPVAQFSEGSARLDRAERETPTLFVRKGRGTYDPGLALCGTEQGGNRE